MQIAAHLVLLLDPAYSAVSTRAKASDVAHAVYVRARIPGLPVQVERVMLVDGGWRVELVSTEPWPLSIPCW